MELRVVAVTEEVGGVVVVDVGVDVVVDSMAAARRRARRVRHGWRRSIACRPVRTDGRAGAPPQVGASALVAAPH